MNAHHSPSSLLLLFLLLLTLFSWTAPNRYPLWQPLLGRHNLPLRLKTYCVMRLADGNLFMRTADIFWHGEVVMMLVKGLCSVFL